MKRVKIFLLTLGMIGCIAGCQKTPEESAVVSKADGLEEASIAEPLEEGETRETDIPRHWEMSEEKSNGQAVISADLELDVPEIGNLPVAEMKNHEMLQEELENLVTIFAAEESLYVPQLRTKEDFQKIKNRIEQKEGAYADANSWSYYQDIEKRLDEAIKAAPETTAESEKTEVDFQNKWVDEAQEIAKGRETEAVKDIQAYFAADVGEDRSAHIEAESYREELANCSEFLWKSGAAVINEEDLLSSQRLIKGDSGEYNADYAKQFEDILEKLLDLLGQTGISEETALSAADEILEKTDAPEMSLLSSEKILWFPENSCADREDAGTLDDLFWQAEPDQAVNGYRFTFTREISGLSAQSTEGYLANSNVQSYAPPFPVETITVVITADGVKSFEWKGMAEETGTIAENTNLLAFESIQEKLSDQIFYWYSAKGQPEGNPTIFDYKITDARLGYSYITAYENPQNAWLVPTWFFEVMESVNGEEYQLLPIAIDALEGRVII